MKPVKFVAIAFFAYLSTIKLNAQTQGSYITNTTMGAFHGTWQWVNGIDTVRLYLITKKTYIDINGGFYWDRLTGWHIYKNGNNILESSFNAINNIDQSTFSGGNGGSGSVNIVKGTFSDISKNKEGRLTLTLNSTQNQLTWRLTEHEGLRVYAPPHTPPPLGFTLPKNMVLIKL